MSTNPDFSDGTWGPGNFIEFMDPTTFGKMEVKTSKDSNINSIRCITHPKFKSSPLNNCGFFNTWPSFWVPGLFSGANC